MNNIIVPPKYKNFSLKQMLDQYRDYENQQKKGTLSLKGFQKKNLLQDYIETLYTQNSEWGKLYSFTANTQVEKECKEKIESFNFDFIVKTITDRSESAHLAYKFLNSNHNLN